MADHRVCQLSNQQLLNDLGAETYTGGIILSYGGDLFVGPDANRGLMLQRRPHPWVLKQGHYDHQNPAYHLTGYWISKYDVNQCWKAVNANGQIWFWNNNGQAQGPPSRLGIVQV